MNQHDRKAWREKTRRLNFAVIPYIGMEVKDEFGRAGVVVEIRVPEDNEDHGSISVWQKDRIGYGADNCEHFCYTNWHEFLRRKE